MKNNKKKFSIILSIATLCLCFSILAFGVYAAKKASLTTTGSVSFEAHNCKVRVLGSVAGAYDSTGTEKTVTPLTDTDTSQGKPISGDVEWAIGDVYFDDLNCSNDEIATPIEFTFKMTNESDYAVTAEISLSGDLSTKITSTVAFAATGSETITSSGFVCVLNKTKTVTATLTMVPKTEEKLDKINLNNLKLKFEKTQALEVSSLSGFSVSLNNDTMTASVSGDNTSGTVSENVEVPLILSSNDQLYIVNTISNNAFKESSNLASISIPSSVTTISDDAFYKCSNLTQITIPDSVTSIGVNAFYQSGLTSIVIPSSVEEIGGNAFAKCSDLSSVEISDGVKKIGFSAFYQSGVTNIIIPNSVDSIGTGVFQDCKSLVSITLSNSIKKISMNSFYGCSLLNNVTIPNSVTEIDTNAFRSCTSLNSIHMSININSIGENAFTNTKYVNEYETECQDENLIYLYAEKDNSYLVKIAVIGYINSITSVTLEDTIKVVGANAFKNCESLTSFVCSRDLENIDYQAFYGCNNLESIIFNKKIKNISGGAFGNCGITNIVSLPSSIEKIGSSVFFGCTNLTSIKYQGSKAQWGAITLTFDWRPTTLTTVHCTDGDIDLTA